ncbi:ARM repeat superfamily protein [Wolffia australiana]
MDRLLSNIRTRLRIGNDQIKRLSSVHGREEVSIEEEAEKKAGWLLKIIFVGSASYLGFQFFPYMGDNLLQQSIFLLQVRDPLFKRMGASRLTRFAVDDGRRLRVIEMGGARPLLEMLDGAKDDRTRREALKTLAALARSDEVSAALSAAGAERVVSKVPDSSETPEIQRFKSDLIKRFRDLR